MNPEQIVGDVVKLLAPHIQQLVGAAVHPVAQAAEAKVRAVYEAIVRKFAGNPAAEEALQDLAKHPEHPDTQGAMRNQLRKMIEADPEFARSLEQRLKEASSVVSSQATLINSKITAGDDSISVIAGQATVHITHDKKGNRRRKA